MAKGLTDDELKALTDNEIRQAIGGTMGGKLSESRRKAEYYYLGLAKGDLSPPDIDGRSSFVDTTIRNQIEWMTPTLLKIFTASENVVEFSPTKEGDEDKADMATEYINHLFYKKNEGYKVLQTAIRDALLQKAGIIKCWWDDRQEETKEEYRGLSDIDLAQLMKDDEIEPIEHKTYPDEEDAEQRQEELQHLTEQLQQAQQATANEPQAPAGQMGQPSPPSQAMQAVQGLMQQIQQIQAQPVKMLYDVSFKRTKEGGKLCIEAVPPEEFIISRKAKTMHDGFMKGHRVMRTVSDLKAMGYDNVDHISSDDAAGAYSGERIERLGWDDDIPYLNTNDTSLDPSMRLVWVTEMYMQVDYDGDGIAEWRKIVRSGDQLLENVECDGAPFAALVPILLPHRFFGLSIADLGFESQKLQTQLIRSTLDNQFLQVNGRYYAVEGQVNLDDLLTSRPGGVVRMKQAGMAGRLDQATGDTAGSMQMMQWAQDFAENATGWTRQSQGVGAQGLNQQTATGMNIISNRDDMRLDLIARNFAEGGLTDLFNLMLKLVGKYQNKEEVISVSGKWTNIDPREWKNKFTLNINVGLGTNNKEQQAQHLMGLMQIQEKALAIGVANPENVYNAAKLYAQALGQKSGDKFFTDPAKAPPQPPQPPQPNPEMIKAQAQAQQQDKALQADVQKHQAEQATRSQELQLEAQRDALKSQHQAEVDQHKAELDMQERQHEAQLKAELHTQQLQFDAAKHDSQLEHDKWKTIQDNETKLLIAQIAAQVTLTKQQDQAADYALNDADD
jgi:hypothetical protein